MAAGKMRTNLAVCFIFLFSLMTIPAAIAADSGYEAPGEYRAGALLQP